MKDKICQCGHKKCYHKVDTYGDKNDKLIITYCSESVPSIRGTFMNNNRHCRCQHYVEDTGFTLGKMAEEIEFIPQNGMYHGKTKTSKN